MFSGSNNVDDVAWYFNNANWETHAVSTKVPNELSLFQMSGNVFEWCQDYYHDEYYENSSSKNPKGPKSGKERVCRGGSWFYIAGDCRSTFRHHDNPSDHKNVNGFRVALDL